MAAMSAVHCEQAARALLLARRTRRPADRLPPEFRPDNAQDAIAIQACVQRLLGASTGGWKCSVPTVERPIACAPIFADKIVRTSPCPWTGGPVAKIEPEVAFVLGRDLVRRGTPYAEAELRSAIAETRLVLELLDSRYADPAAANFPELLADNISNLGLFVGPLLERGLDVALERFPVSVSSAGRVLHSREGRHPDGHPLRPLVWLAGYLAERDEPLRAGQIVTTGSYAGALEVPLGEPLIVRFGDLGTIEVELSAS
jgi:2-keto-4-pentenoate hydratase